MSDPYRSDPYQRRSERPRSVLPLALIAIGSVFLLGNLVPGGARGGLLLLALGAAFLVGRVMTGRYGYAVPAGLLIAIGAYLSLQHLQARTDVQSPGWFFALLGLGFVLVYLIGLRPSAVWPLFPGAVLLGLGLVLFGMASLGALASLDWIVACWPLALVLLGLWLLFRHRVPLDLQRPLARLGGLALLAYGILAAAVSVAAGGANGPGSFSATVSRDAPIVSGQTLSVDNPNGRTTINAGSGSTVHVLATSHYTTANQGPEIRLTPGSGGLTLTASSTGSNFPFGGSSSVDYTVDVPAGVDVNVTSSSGHIAIDGLDGNVKAEAGSGGLELINLTGAVQARSSSGAIQLDNIGGDVRVTTTSGQVRAGQLRHLREATSSSGSMTFEGTFVDPAQIHATSGSITLRLSPGSAVQLDVKTQSGSVEPQNLVLSGGTTSRTRLSGALGSPAAGATLSVDTSSGSVRISQ